MNEVKAWNRVADLGSSLRAGEGGLRDAPALLALVLREKAWRRFVTPRHEVVEHDSFAEFVTTPPTHGLGVSVDLVRRLVADDIEVLDLLDRALQQPVGVNNVNTLTHRPEGNASSTALRRLRKDRPDLHSEVLSGSLSAHAAMVKAGFRPKTATVRLDDPRRAAATIKAAATPEFLIELRRHLGGG
jgi:hypothetical protein